MITQFRTIDKKVAQDKAAKMQKDIPEFTYAIQVTSDGHYYIVAYDEFGERVGVV